MASQRQHVAGLPPLRLEFVDAGNSTRPSDWPVKDPAPTRPVGRSDLHQEMPRKPPPHAPIQPQAPSQLQPARPVIWGCRAACAAPVRVAVVRVVVVVDVCLNPAPRRRRSGPCCAAPISQRRVTVELAARPADRLRGHLLHVQFGAGVRARQAACSSSGNSVALHQAGEITPAAWNGQINARRSCKGGATQGHVKAAVNAPASQQLLRRHATLTGEGAEKSVPPLAIQHATSSPTSRQRRRGLCQSIEAPRTPQQKGAHQQRRAQHLGHRIRPSRARVESRRGAPAPVSSQPALTSAPRPIDRSAPHAAEKARRTFRICVGNTSTITGDLPLPAWNVQAGVVARASTFTATRPSNPTP